MTLDWTAGYTAEVDYTYGYYAELNPLRMRLALLQAGLACPPVGAACELGFGQGMSVNLHAAGGGVQWWGTDFNPAQARFAQDLAAAAGAGARLHDDAFADFAQRTDLPDFDFMALHGIWSWVSDANRQVIVDLVRRRLKPGGVLYISYNTMPGWASFAPMRHLLALHGQTQGNAAQGVLARVDGALAFATRLMEAQPQLGKAHPQLAQRLEALGRNNRQYLAHEYFNEHWQPMYFSDMQRWLGGAKLQFACSAHLLDHLDALNLTAPQQALLASQPDAAWRETVRDFLVNQQFRRDYWVKGARRLSALEQGEQWRQLRLMLTSRREGLEVKLAGRLGEAKPQGAVYDAVLDALADHAVLTVGELEGRLAHLPGLTLAKLREVVVALAGAGHVALAQEPAAAEAARGACQRLNAEIMHRSRSSTDFSCLASPVTGGGVAVQRFTQLFLAAQAQGHTNAEGMASHVWNILNVQGQKILKDGKALRTEPENLAALQQQAQEFLSHQLPLLQRLGVA
ncbi:class I SAM-dependent methyltransferase [Acidovorax sp. JG5]|uniref:class I SAM-dependent methyltransferase n=1 Tax=Acidovorax sp. JG5 TaxID=2822718 RepID=UPI001B31E286|nr:class I SAM-dependent methyltransferase [Acidovorax sp. JG5]MBP3979786.1 class I SAM-dependent methyltransferase [Acidovorax sp. JG5]